eukprot:gene16165-11561_t
MSDSQLTLYYLPFRARAEAIRMILEYAGIQYQDVTVSMKDWMGIKGHTEIAPFDQLPSMRLPSGEIIAETGAIVRLVAKLAKIYPEDPFAAARADMVYEFAVELNVINPLLNFWPIHSEAWQTNYASFFQNLPRNLNIIQGMLGDQAFFGGPTPHHGDFAIFHILDTCLTVKEDSVNSHPALLAYMERIRSIPAIGNYLQKRADAVSIGLCGSFMQIEVARVFHQSA